MKILMPVVDYQNEQLMLMTPQMASVPFKALKRPVGSLAHFRNEIIATLDFAITGL
jgi:toxin CcdB